MPPLTADAWVLALAAVICIFTAHATLSIAVRVSNLGAGKYACTVLLSALALGFGLWTQNFLQVLATWLPEQPQMNGSWFTLPFAIAALSQACALVFVARREPDAPGIAGCAFALAVGVGATRFATLDDLPGPQGLNTEVLWVFGSLLLTFGTLCGALWIHLGSRGDRSWRARLARIPATLAAGLGIFGANAQTLFQSNAVFPPCCTEPQLSGHLLALGAGALGCAILTVAHVVAICHAKLEERASRNARDLEEVHARLHYLATHDSLTGLPNRQRFKDRLLESLADSARPGRTVAVAVIDLDRFRAINHSLGHGIGDWLLTEVARRIAATARGCTMLARLGGDEFGVLIDNVAARFAAQGLTAAIMAAFEDPLRVNGVEFRLRPTIGVSVWPDDGRRGDDLLAHAEAALTLAKQRGGGQVQFFRPGLTDTMQERMVLENDLRRALAADEFELHFQPEIDARSGRVAAAEVLLRWRHPTKGIIGPSAFIALAEETGLIIPLGEWVLREACRQARTWRLAYKATFPLAVNLSAAQFRHQNLVQLIQSALSDATLEASALEIELTESALMTNPDEAAGVLKQLRRMGVSVAIDDFGTGYSSLSYLRRLPIDKLKIDRSFIRELTSNRTDESIVRAIVSLARGVGLKVVAEGIESAEQLDFVTRLGCDQWQGYYCRPPLSAARFGDMLAAGTENGAGFVVQFAGFSG